MLMAGSKQWLLAFNTEKCNVMHIRIRLFGHDLPTVYTMSDGNNTIQLQTVTVQKDLGVYITNDLKSTEQCIQTNFRKHKLVLVVMSTTSGLDLDDLHCDWSVWTGLSIAACALCTGIANFGRGPLRLLAVSNLVCCIIALLN